MPQLPTLAQALKGGNNHPANGPAAAGSNSLPTLSEALAQPHPHQTPPHHGGGFLHELGHIAGQTATDLYNTAVHSPEGLYQVGKATVEAAAGHPHDLVQIGKATGKGFLQDFEHPLRHPGNTLLDLSSALSLGAGAAARAAEVGRVVDAGGTAADIARAAAKGPKPEARVLDYGGEKVQAGEYSRSASLRATQKLVDRFQQRFPDVRLPVRNLHGRVGKELAANRAIDDAVGRHPAHQLGKVKLSAAKQTALRVVAEGVPIDERIAFHRAQLPTVGAKLQMATKKQIGLLRRAQKYVHDVTVDGHTVPRLRPEHADLIDAYELARRVAGKRESLLSADVRLVRGPDGTVHRVAGLGDAAAGRVDAPGSLIRHGRPGAPEAVADVTKDITIPYTLDQFLRDRPEVPGYLLHGSPEGDITKFDPTYHTRTWREGHGFYVTPSREKALKYAEGKTAKADRRTSAGKLNYVKMNSDARVLDFESSNEDFWRHEAEKITGEKIDPKVYRQWASLASEGDHAKNASPGVLGHLGLIEYLRGYEEMPFTDAYYGVDEALREAGVHATHHLEGATPVFVLKDEKAGHIVPPHQIFQEARAAGHLKDKTYRMQFNPRLAPEVFKDGDFRVPYAMNQAKGALGQIAGYKGGIPRTPGSVNHSFTGALLKAGGFRSDTSKLVAESYLEAHRFTALIRHRDEFLRLAHDEKQSQFDVPIRTDQLHNRPWPKIIEDLTENGHLTADHLDALENYFDEARNEVFPPEADILKTLGPGAHPDVKWIDERLLGGINKPNPLVGFTGGARTGLKTFDAINNASRLAILYLKPAYAVPNLLGNLGLTLVQQGFAAPLNLAKAARLNARLGPELASKVDTAMGEGVTGALHTQGGLLDKVVNKAANVWQGPVDTPFRRASFLHEAARHGFKTKAQIAKLFDSPEDLARVTREANAELIDYGRLGPFERNVIRRVVFFYPWVKGSTVYAARFLGTHPQQAAVLGHLGEQGAAADAADLGPLPSYADGIFKVGERGNTPLTVNPAAAGILQTPAQLLQAVRELGSKHPGQAFQLSQNFTPAVAVALALLARQGVNNKQTALQGAEQQLVGGLPVVSLAQGLMHPPSESTRPKLYPRTRADVVAHFLLGGIAPTPVNQAEARYLKYKEDHPH